VETADGLVVFDAVFHTRFMPRNSRTTSPDLASR
jgi:hypothetical protein